MFKTSPSTAVASLVMIVLLCACGGGEPATDSGAGETAGTPMPTGSAGRAPEKETGPAVKGTLTAASIEAGGEGAMSDLGVSRVALSADGNWLAMVSSSNNLVEGQHDALRDSHLPELFLHDREPRGTVLVSHSLGNPAQTSIAQSDYPDVSADGRWVAYQSSSIDLVPSDGQRSMFHNQVFLYDRETGANLRMSNAAGTIAPSNGASEAVSISADGRWVAYQSNAQNLVAGQVDRPGTDDIFLYDRERSENILVSHAAGNPLAAAGDSSIAPAISADGRWVAYVSYASDLVEGLDDPNGNGIDIFLYDRETGGNMLVSRAGHDPVTAAENSSDTVPPSISDNGRYVVYVSHAVDIVPGMVDDAGDAMVFIFDRQSGKNTLVSHAAGQPQRTCSFLAEAATISGDGNWVVFASEASNLVEGQDDSEVRRNIYLWERATGTARLVSHRAGSPLASPNQNSYSSAISRDGRFIAFDSDAPHLVAGQADEEMGLDVFLYDRDTAAITLVSHAAGNTKQATNGTPSDIAISADGRAVAFMSYADGLTPEDANGQCDAFFFVQQ